MSDLSLALALGGGVVFMLSLGSGLLHRDLGVVSEPMVALAVGVVVDPLGVGLLDPAAWGDPLRGLVRSDRDRRPVLRGAVDPPHW